MKKGIIGTIGFLLLFGVFYLFGDDMRNMFLGEDVTVYDFDPTEGVKITIGDTVVATELALTRESQRKGLSGRSSLPSGTGMLFVYSKPDQYMFWMPDMNFSLDIIWFDSDFTVIDITPNVSPDSFPDTFTSKLPAQFVLEVPAGYAQEKGMKVGMKATVQQ